MNRLVAYLLVFTVILTATSCGGGDVSTPVLSPPTPAPTSPFITPTKPPSDSETPLVPDEKPISAELQQRLDYLVARLEKERQEHHIPGMALAVVKDDRVVLAQGFGLADIEKEIPVKADTMFAIGSSTKAFTATAIAMLVNEDKMYWNDPVTDHLPYFTLKIKSDNPDAVVLIRDLLCHRTGFPRMGILTASGEIPREEVLQAATNGEPLTDFREKFYYNNEMYLAAGVAAGKVAGTDWDSLVTERIFKPLGMTRTNTSISAAQQDPQMAKGYRWEDALDEHIHQPMHQVDNIGPAGSINSNVMDMAQWLRFQLGRGVYDGERLLDALEHRDTWTKQIEIIEDYHYGLGWFLAEWEGQTVVEHGGNVDGFSATVAMLPESNLGFVLLSNVTASPLQQTSLGIVWETLIGDLSKLIIENNTHVYAPYLGKFINHYGPLAERLYTVTTRYGRLALDANGENIYELKAPDNEGRWYFAVSDQAAVSFTRNSSGEVIALNIHQGGLVFDIPREGTEFEAEINLEDLQFHLGSYRSEELQTTIKVKIQNNRLAVDWPGEMVYELNPPDINGIWFFRVNPDISVKFYPDSEGSIMSLNLYQADREYLMERLLENEETPPTIGFILNLREPEKRNSILDSWGIYQIIGTQYFPHAGVSGDLTITIEGYSRARIESDYGKWGQSVETINDGEVWDQTFGRPLQQLHGKQLDQTLRGFPSRDFGDWRQFFDSMQVVRSSEEDGRKVYILKLKSEDLPEVTAYIDAETGDLLRSEGVILATGNVGIYVVTRFEDYRDVDGMRIAFRTISENQATGRVVVEIDEIKTNLSVTTNFYTITD